MIADKAFTMADLRSMNNESIVLPTIRDALNIRVREDGKRMNSDIILLNILSLFNTYEYLQAIRSIGIIEIYPYSDPTSNAPMELFTLSIIHF